MKNIHIFGSLSNSANRCGRQEASLLTLQDITVFHLMNIVEPAKKYPVYHDIVPAQRLKLDGTNITLQHKLTLTYTPDYIITGCKGTTPSVIRNGINGASASNSTKRCGETSSPKPKRYTATDMTGSLRFKLVLSPYVSPKGGLQGDRTSFTSLNQLPLLWVARQNFYNVN